MTGVELALVVLASLVGSFVKSVTGMGYPLVAIPFLTLFIGVEEAVAIVAIPNAAANLLLNVHVREHRSETRDLPVLIAVSMIGAVIGTLVLTKAPEEPLLIGLAVTVFLFVVQRVRSPEFTLTPATTKRAAPAVGVLAGFAQGAVGVSGPILAGWFHGYRLSKNGFVFSLTAVFFMSGIAQLGILVVQDAYDRDLIVAAGLALVATLAVMPVGTRLRGRIGGRTLENLILGLLVVSGTSLVLRALT